jgi:hypothetical protein
MPLAEELGLGRRDLHLSAALPLDNLATLFFRICGADLDIHSIVSTVSGENFAYAELIVTKSYQSPFGMVLWSLRGGGPR